jgi:hypothetical protein
MKKMASQESMWQWEQGTKYAAEAIKTTLLLNGAAAIALMTFATTNPQKFSSLLCPLISFVIGALISAFAFFAAYMVQRNYGNAARKLEQATGQYEDEYKREYKRLWEAGDRWGFGAIGSVGLSVLLFCLGMALAACALSKLAAG